MALDYIQPAFQVRRVAQLLELVTIRVKRGEIPESLESSRETEETGLEICPPSVITVSRGDCFATGKTLRDEVSNRNGEPPYEPEEDDDGPIILTPPPEPDPPVWPDDYPPGTPDPGPRPPWWPDDFPWPPQPEEPVVIENPPSPHIWPRLPPDHPYHLPPGSSYPDNLPAGHPGAAYPGMPGYPVVHPGDWGDDWPSYPGILDNWPPAYEEE